MDLARIRFIGERGRFFAVAAGMLAMSAVASPALGQAETRPTAVREEERTALYQEGLALAETGRWEDALSKFEKVVAIRSAPRALFALARAEEKSGRWTRAKRTYVKTQTEAEAAQESKLVEEATGALRS